ncbi:hypothetical protein F5Y16DRAFT_11931 [Xylariaceae sp. FL0255]|nr:hypothetical protein F5Y16DRAFT_11931 [Xylariaceae sp. FL0255]
MRTTMVRGLILSALACCVVATTTTQTLVSTSSAVACSALYGSGGKAPLATPTSGTTVVSSSVTTSPTETLPAVYVRATAEPVTTTLYTSVADSIVFATVTSGTYTNWVNKVTTISTVTYSVTACTNNVTPTTVTQYTGTYTPMSGQSTATDTYITGVTCTTSLTSLITYYPILSTGTSTVWTTSTVYVPKYTASSVSDIVYATLTVYAATVTSTAITYTPVAHATTVSMACAPTVTATYDARCAPNNIISSIDGMGLLASGQYAANTSVVYLTSEPYESDSSLCCQTCLDNEGCAASMSGESGFCGLFYSSDQSGKAECGGEVYTFETSENTAAGQGIRAQSGCGTVKLTT